MYEELPTTAGVVRHVRVRDRRLRLRSVFSALVAVFTVIVTALATDVIAQAAVTGCQVRYVVGAQWLGGSAGPGGFTGTVEITNVGDAETGWRVDWTFPDGQRVTQAWGATITTGPAGLVATNADWNAYLPTNGMVAFGFNATWSGSNGAPPQFTLNGVPCTGTVGTTPPAYAPN